MSLPYAYNDPSVSGPNFKFNTGAIVNGATVYYSYTANIPYSVDTQWAIIGWHSDTFLDPAVFTEANQAYADAVFGTPDYTWTNQDSTMILSTYGTSANFVYRLTVKDGQNGSSTGIGDSSPGGRNLFLSTLVSAPTNFTFDKKITFSARERLSQIFWTGNGSDPTSGSNSFTVSFNSQSNPHYNPSLPTLGGFLQFPLADSRGSPPAWGQSQFSVGNFAWNAVSTSAGGDYMTWGSDEGGLHNVTIDLNSAIVGLAEFLTPSHAAYASSLMDMSLWSLGTYFYGGESLNGSGATFDIANPVVTMDDSQSFNSSMASTKFVSIERNYQTVYDTGNISTATSQTWNVSNADDYTINMDGQTLNTNVVLSRSDTVYAGSASGEIFANGPSLEFVGGSGYTVPVLAGGNDSVTGGTGEQLIFTGTSGTLTYWTDPATPQPIGDTSYRHWVIADGSDQKETINFLGGGVKSALYIGSGNSTVHLGTAGDYVAIDGNGGTPILDGGNSDIYMGSGNDTVLVKSITAGIVNIFNFDPSHDFVVLDGQAQGITHTYPTDDGSTRYLLNGGHYITIHTVSNTPIPSGDPSIIMT